jgi:hypothetical protein
MSKILKEIYIPCTKLNCPFQSKTLAEYMSILHKQNTRFAKKALNMNTWSNMVSSSTRNFWMVFLVKSLYNSTFVKEFTTDVTGS